MRRRWVTGLRARLLLATAFGSLLAVAALVSVFNLVLDNQLRGDVDGLLRERAAAQLRTLTVSGGRLQVPEAPDQAARDTQTWIFIGQRAIEQPANAAASQQAVLTLLSGPRDYATATTSDSRLHAVPIAQGARRLGTLVVAASLVPYQRSAHTALVASLILGALTVLGVALLAAWVISRALAPVSRMAADAAGWQEHEPMRRFLLGEPHDELTELAATFDRLLSRLSANLEREQRFTAEISHELRTPLAAIVAEAELALAQESATEGYRQALSTILASAEDLAASLEALLTAARAGGGASVQPVAARSVADRAAERGRQTVGPARITVAVHAPASDLRVAVEPELAERALMPIVENAVRFASHRVDIAVRADNGHAVFEVSDDGPGVQAAMRERIFEPGVSFPQDRSGGASGAGLGLALARRLARAGGGDVQCLPADGGAHFTLRLPAG